MPNATGTKRKATTAQGGSKSKKTRQEDYTAAKDLIDALLACDDIEDVEIDRGDALNLAAYARHLESEVAEHKPKEKSASEISSAAEKLRAVTVSGIQKQMGVRTFFPFSPCVWADLRRIYISGSLPAKLAVPNLAVCPILLLLTLFQLNRRRHLPGRGRVRLHAWVHSTP